VKAKGREALQELVARAPSFFVYLLDKLSRENDPKSERGKLQISRQMVEWLAKIPSAVLQSTFVQQTAARLEVPAEAIIQELRRFRGRQRPGEVSEETPEAPAETVRGTAAEQTLLQLMLADERIVDLVLERVERKWLSASVAGKLVNRVLELHEKGRWDGPAGLLGRSQEEEPARLVSELIMKALPGVEHSGAAQDCLAALERNALERESRAVRQELARPGVPTEELTILQKQMLDLRRRMDNIAAPSRGSH